MHVEGASALPSLPKGTIAIPKPGEASQSQPCSAKHPPAGCSGVDEPPNPAVLPACCWRGQEEGRKGSRAGEIRPSRRTEVLTPPGSSVGSGLDGWWDTSTSLTAPGEAGGGVFLLRVVARGVGSCFWLRQDPWGFVPCPAFPKPGWAAECQRLGVLG